MVSRKARGMWGKRYPQNYKRLKKVLLFGFSFNSFTTNLYQKCYFHGLDHLLLPLSHLTISYNIYCCALFTMHKSLSVRTSCQTADLVFLLKFCNVRLQKKLYFTESVLHVIPACSRCYWALTSLKM